MLRRTWFLVRARLAIARRSAWPIPALLFHATLGTVLALLVRDALPAFPYALFALTIGTLLLALPLLSDLGAIVRHDEAEEWAGGLPVRPTERTLARAVHLLILLAALVGAWFTPWAILAPIELGLGARLALPALGLALALLAASLLIWTQALLLERAQGLFLLLEAGLLAGIVVALLELLGHLPELAQVDASSPRIAWFPPAWYARAVVSSGWSFVLPTLLALGSAALLLVVPVRTAGGARRRSWLERMLAPLRATITRIWVRSDERGAFDLVWSALPREREVAIRTWPMLGIPLAFLWAGASRPDGGLAWRGDLLALLLFTAGIYLPLLLVHVPLSESHRASWLLRTAPCPPEAITGGAIKALFARWLLPLYACLFVLGAALGESGLLARLWLPAVLLALWELRLLYPRCVRELPLSVAPEDLTADVDWAGILGGLAAGLTVLAVLANRFLTLQGGLGVAALLLGAEWTLERRHRRPRHPSISGASPSGDGV